MSDLKKIKEEILNSLNENVDLNKLNQIKIKRKLDDSVFVWFYKSRGELYEHLKQHDKAEEDFIKVIELNRNKLRS